jgi:hypothetical protein
METATLPGVGDVRLLRTADGLSLVCINDVLRHLRACTPSRMIAARHPSRQRAKVLDGQRALHFFDVASAIILASTVRKRPQEQQLRVVEGLIAIGASNVATVTVAAPAAPAPDPALFLEPTRPPGKTVREMLREMGLEHAISVTRAGVVVAAAYEGERHRWPGTGMVYTDERQLALILRRHAREKIEAATRESPG